MYLWASLLLATFTFQAVAEETDAAASLTKSLENIQTFRANFVQKIRGADGDNVSKSSGEMMVRRPGKFYWKSQAPDPVLVVADGKHLWTYDIDLAQVTKQDLNQALGNTPASLLAGSVVNLKDSFKISTAKKNQCRGSDECYSLHPLSKDAAVADIVIGFAKGKLQEISMHDSLGQDVYTKFSKVEINKNLENKIFDFVPPKGVDVIHAGN
ncbi:MAG: outer membrane lipoprotein carrier protein LolA [Gammaproteobacteria bacterium 39-13]|nr:MAG: outer membrane lipoprotein carrier protein LolA [Gammaproteobacteria bacterium 39-13]